MKYQVKRNRFQRMTGLFLLCLFIGYWGCIVQFTHVHVVNGVVIVHSHPFGKSHGHTAHDFQTIFYLSHFVTANVPKYPVPALIRNLLRTMPVMKLASFRQESAHEIFSIRAPPLS